MTPPAAEELVPRLFLGPALRTQSDGRLVRLVRDGYEAAFDEIVHRYGGPLRRYAAAIVGGRAEDVTQEAFSKALQALRRDESEIELRPWLYRIVRNTALNDIRDRPPSSLALVEAIEGHRGVAEEVERREEVAELLGRLRALPEAQRAAIVMRELEGLGHDEIATALGITGGAARQAIHRARTALRNGLGMAIPLPLLKLMLEGGGAPSAEIAAGGAGAGVVLKAATATVLVAGTFGAGVALHEGTRGEKPHRPASASSQNKSSAAPTALASTGPVTGPGRSIAHRSDNASQGGGRGPSHDAGRGGSGGHGGGSDEPQGSSGRHDSTSGPRGHHPGPSPPESSGHSGGSRGDSPSEGGNSSPGNDSLLSGDSADGGSSSGSGDGGTSGGGDGSGDLSGSGGGSDSNSGPSSGADSGSEEASSSGSSDSRDSHGGDGFSLQMEPLPQED